MPNSYPLNNAFTGLEFHYERHVNYLLKALRKTTFGDDPLGPNLAALFMIVSGLDILGALNTRLNKSDRQEIVEFIYSFMVSERALPLQVLQSSDQFACKDQSLKMKCFGFRQSNVIDDTISFDNGCIIMTYCALSSLVILGDDLERVKRNIESDSKASNEKQSILYQTAAKFRDDDVRIIYCAAVVSCLLNDWSGLNRDNCAKYIKNCLSYEGAFGMVPGAEAHGGATYCALAALKLMSKLEDTLNERELEGLKRWCINRLNSGFSGRTNKEDDTCYSFWIGSCLKMLGHFDDLEQESIVKFSLMAQDEPGGLSKTSEYSSDVMHTLFGLAGLTFINDNLRSKLGINVSKLDPTLIISERSRQHLDYIHQSQPLNQKAE